MNYGPTRHFMAAVSVVCILAMPSAAADISKTFAAAKAGSQTQVNHAEWAGLLDRYLQVEPAGINRFAYGRVTAADRSWLQSYLARLQKVDPRQLSPREQNAFWINFYNALTIEVVLKHYPVKSIRDISSGLFTQGPWDFLLVTVNGQKLSLNNIEHDILRAGWRDSRVHYALNCASLGCPDLAPVPYAAKSLDGQLDTAARAFINHPRGVSLHNSRLVLSSIFDWYRKDFDGDSDQAVIAHIRKYARPQLAAQLGRQSRINGYQYDWRLNAPGSVFSAPQ